MTIRHIVAALLMGAATLGLSACDDDDNKPKETAVKIYKSVDECKADEATSNTDCEKAFENAKEEHIANAPKIPTREECTAKYGIDACVSRRDPSTGNEWFAPAMTGFMIGHMLNSSTPSYQPVYIDRSGSAYSGRNQLGSFRSTCAPGINSSCGSGGFVAAPSTGASSAWTRSYSTTTITPTAKGSSSYTVAPSSTRGGFGSTASPSVSSPSRLTAPSAVAPSGASARGGFGGSASSSAGG